MALAAIALAKPAAVKFGALPPLALYAHLPWCVRKCPYCDFNSHEQKAELPEREYVDALIADLEGMLPSVWGRRVHSVFLGGGTPSLFSPASIDRLLSGVRARLQLEPDAEITMEANPGTVEARRFREFRAAGVNRLSLGVQSFEDAKLKALGRIHDADEARRAAGIALENFDNVNLDLMYGLPGQTLDEARADLAQALRFGTPHLSAYQLTIEPNTVFYRHPPRLPEHDAGADMQAMVEETLAGAGYRHYETSAFARPGRHSRHNRNYWEFGDYLGIGAGAHGKLSFPHRVLRQIRYRDPARYMAQALAGNAVAQEDEVARGELPFEFMLNALRLKDGFDLARFAERTGLALSAIEAGLLEAERRGLIERDLQRVRPTARGFDLLSDLQALFLPAR